MSQPLNADQELVSDVVACQLVIKQILDNICIYARKRNVTSDPDDDKPKKHKQKFVSDLFRLKRIFYRFKH